MIDLQFNLLRWSAWAPGLSSEEQWRAWAEATPEIIDDGQSPKLPFVPPMLRRRCSRLTRMSLQTADDCLAGLNPVQTIFCSQHGEIHRTLSLLQELAHGNAVSPMGFSLSVHNSASGIFGIANNDSSLSTAISAGVDTLEMAMIEAAGVLLQRPQHPVLVVIADEPLPEFYHPFTTPPLQTVPVALAMLLGGTAVDDSLMAEAQTLSLSATVNAGQIDREARILPLIRWLARKDTDPCVLPGERCCWQWKQDHG